MKLLALMLAVIVGTISWSSDIPDISVANATLNGKVLAVTIKNAGNADTTKQVYAEVIVGKACWVQPDGTLDPCQQVWLKGTFYPNTTSDAEPSTLDYVRNLDLNIELLRVAKVRGE